MEYLPTACFGIGTLLPLHSVACIINDDTGVRRKSRGRLARGNIETSVAEEPCENSQRELRDNGVEQSGYESPENKSN